MRKDEERGAGALGGGTSDGREAGGGGEAGAGRGAGGGGEGGRRGAGGDGWAGSSGLFGIWVTAISRLPRSFYLSFHSLALRL